MNGETGAFKATELEVTQWIDANGNPTDPIKLSDFKDKFKVIYCFQSWCPGCHSNGFPALKKMVDALSGNDKVAFLAIQTVFEGHDENTYDKLVPTQQQYGLKIPFGHDAGDGDPHNISKVMMNFGTGGTPWFILIDQQDTVVFADFNLHVENAISFLRAL
ncbi:MAG TPA: redoxin family protein [Arenibacter sp.]|nr:redoxin family protein [Arenibacter sp.]